MSQKVLILADSGFGKSYSIKGLNPADTFIVSIAGKKPPYKGGVTDYTSVDFKENTGNFLSLRGIPEKDVATKLMGAIDYVSTKRKDIRNLIIDDLQFVIGNEFMSRAEEKGYDLFKELSKKLYLILNKGDIQRDELIIYFMNHVEYITMPNGQKKGIIKTVGNMLQNHATPEGTFDIVLSGVASRKPDRTVVREFITNDPIESTSKSPEGLFDTDKIPNDLGIVERAIRTYYNI